jgi:RNA polymerase sigma factor (TIGR02999 family)
MSEVDQPASLDIEVVSTPKLLSRIDELLPVAYDELRSLAEAILSRCQPIESTHTTSLINDVYVRLAARGVRFRDRGHFLCVAAKAMRFVLIDRARRNSAAKRGGDQKRLVIDDSALPTLEDPQMLAIDEALNRLSAFDERKGRVVELRFFGGLSVEETADVLGLSSATVKREWAMARAWLSRELTDDGNVR